MNTSDLKSIDILDEICFEAEFVEWLKSVTDEVTFKKFSKTRQHIIDNELLIYLEISKHKKYPHFRIRIRGEDDDVDNGMTFEFYRMRLGKYRFGIEEFII